MLTFLRADLETYLQDAGMALKQRRLRPIPEAMPGEPEVAEP
jgi:hypothetical protein